MRSDRLIIEGVAAECRLGVFEWEQQRPQTIWVDLELAIDAGVAAARDDVRDAIDYAQLVDAVRARLQQQPYRLMEAAAQAIARLVLARFATRAVRVRVKKRALDGIGFAAVEIERTSRRGPSRRSHGLDASRDGARPRSRVGTSRASGRFPRAARR